MTKETGEAWRDLREDKEFFAKLFEKTCCPMTVDGSGDKKLQPPRTEGLCFLKYSFPLLVILPSCFDAKP